MVVCLSRQIGAIWRRQNLESFDGYSLASSRNLTSWLLGPLDTWGGLWAYGAFPRLTWPGLGLLGVGGICEKGGRIDPQ
jgi:hypothetical protein